jgi:hypothetical protein
VIRYALLVLPLALLVGCGTTPTTPPTEKPKHNHPSLGPHGGPLVEWGEDEMHLEVVIDRPTGVATVYVLDEEAKAEVPLTAKSLTLSLTGEPPTAVTLNAVPNSSSKFVGTHELFKKDDKQAGSVSGEHNGKRYSGKFREKAVQ